MEHAKANSSFVPFRRDCKSLSSVRVKSLTDGISMWIVRYGHRLLDVIHGVQLRNYGILKTSALVTVNTGQDAIHIEPFFLLKPWQQ